MDACSSRQWMPKVLKRSVQEEFQENVKVLKLQTLRHEFQLLNMRESEIIKDYYSRIEEIVGQMRDVGKILTTKKLSRKFKFLFSINMT